MAWGLGTLHCLPEDLDSFPASTLGGPQTSVTSVLEYQMLYADLYGYLPAGSTFTHPQQDTHTYTIRNEKKKKKTI